MKKVSEEMEKKSSEGVLPIPPVAILAKVTMLGTKVINSLLDPQLTNKIIDNIVSKFELDLENKKNKIEYLKKDTQNLIENKEIYK